MSDWTEADERFLGAIRLAAALRMAPPASVDVPVSLKTREQGLFSFPDCEVSWLLYPDVVIPKWKTKLVQKHGLGYVVTPLVNHFRNANARSKGKGEMLRGATWGEPVASPLYLSNRRLFLTEILDEAVALGSISDIKSEDHGVSFQVGVETKDVLPEHFVVRSPNDEMLFVALVYCVRNRVPEINVDESFRARAERAGRPLHGLEI